MNSNFTKALAIGLLFLTTLAEAQDPRYSQFNSAPWAVNPALTGVFNGRYRVVANYRDQWASILGSQPFRTYGVSGDARFNVVGENYLAVGGGILRDEAGASHFTQTRASLGLSYLLKISGGGRHSRGAATQYLVAGFQGGFGQNKVDWSQLWFSNQFNTGTETPDFGAASGETNQQNSTGIFPDMNAGLLWYALFDDNKYVYAGAAMHHLNGPSISLIDDGSVKLYNRITAHVGAQLPVSEQLSLLPGVLYMKQGPAMELNFGSMVRYSNGDRNELALRAGVFSRIGRKLDKGLGSDALIFHAQLELQRWTLGMSYDVNISSLDRASNARGAFELSLIYVHPASRREHVRCPKF